MNIFKKIFGSSCVDTSLGNPLGNPMSNFDNPLFIEGYRNLSKEECMFILQAQAEAMQNFTDGDEIVKKPIEHKKTDEKNKKPVY